MHVRKRNWSQEFQTAGRCHWTRCPSVIPNAFQKSLVCITMHLWSDKWTTTRIFFILSLQLSPRLKLFFCSKKSTKAKVVLASENESRTNSALVTYSYGTRKPTLFMRTRKWKKVSVGFFKSLKCSNFVYRVNINDNHLVSFKVYHVRGKISDWWVLIGWDRGHFFIIKGIFGNQEGMITWSWLV